MAALELNIFKINDEVFAVSDAVAQLTTEHIDFLKARARENKRRTCRLLLHRSTDDALHEMLIVHPLGRYIRPHKNVRSSKSFHVVEGALACILFDDDGAIGDHWIMGEYSGNGTFLVRLSERRYHTLIPLTDTVVFVETILGPFQGTTYAPWAPEEGDSIEATAYYETISKTIELISPTHTASID